VNGNGNRLYSIGELSRRSGLTVRTIRFYSDVGVVPESRRSAAGYRLYDLQATARLDLVSTLRDLGLPLNVIHALLNAKTSMAEVAAVHADALDVQISTLRLRRAVLRAAAKTTTTAAEVALMHQLAKMTDLERQQLLNDFLEDTFGGFDANPDLVALLHQMRPELPDDPDPDQVHAWVELAELVRDTDFRASVRRMAEYQATERAAGDQTELHHDLTNQVIERVTAALTEGIDPSSEAAVPVLDDLVDRYARTFDAADTPDYREALLRRLQIANDPRAERYLHLLSVINGWPTQPSLSPIITWFTAALNAHPARQRQASSAHDWRSR
jgi:DNA-binding transcriptional MerR regulator